MTKHALLSASGAHRWLACTPSARLEETFDDEASEYAREGSFAHEVAEVTLRYTLLEIDEKTYLEQMEALQQNDFYSTELEDHIKNYVDIVMEKVWEAKARSRDALVMVEQRLWFSRWVPEGFGTGDVVIVADDTLEIIDLKYGKGVPISAEGNPQTRLYGLGAWYEYEALYDIRTVRMTIVQPRLDIISTEELPVEELLAWGDAIEVSARRAYQGEGDFVPGEHCQFCRARYTCRARADENLELARYEFKDPPLLGQDEIAEILGQASQLKSWVADIEKYALEQARDHGVKWPGWKLVEGRSNRRYTNEKDVVKTLKKAGYKEKDYFEKKLLGIGKMEKSIGKVNFTELLERPGLVQKPVGKPVLVPEDDTRPELNSVASAVEDFGKK